MKVHLVLEYGDASGADGDSLQGVMGVYADYRDAEAARDRLFNENRDAKDPKGYHYFEVETWPVY